MSFSSVPWSKPQRLCSSGICYPKNLLTSGHRRDTHGERYNSIKTETPLLLRARVGCVLWTFQRTQCPLGFRGNPEPQRQWWPRPLPIDWVWQQWSLVGTMGSYGRHRGEKLGKKVTDPWPPVGCVFLGAQVKRLSEGHEIINGRIIDTQIAEAAAAKSLQSCPTLCDPVDGSPPGSPAPGILQARTLERVVMSFSNAWKWKVKVKSLSCVWLFATPRTAAYQAPLSMGFSRQEDWSGVPLPAPKDTN